jgi:hypothetical protein
MINENEQDGFTILQLLATNGFASYLRKTRRVYAAPSAAKRLSKSGSQGSGDRQRTW